MPIPVVDLRMEHYHDCSLLPFDVVRWVRVHDGNLICTVLHAMEVYLRALRVLPNFYDARPHWLVDAHGALDAAKAAVYGWSADFLRELLALDSGWQ